MSMQFGRWNFDGGSSAPDYLEKVQALLTQYAPDADSSYHDRGIHLLYRAFHTTAESAREIQPYGSPSGAVIAWDGRLDNREDLILELSNGLSYIEPDVAIAAAAYERWKTDCFRKLIGDWSISIWNPRTQILLLAKDLLGTRHLFYHLETKQVSWSTLLDPLVLFAGESLGLEEEYIAGCLSGFPATHLTPYVGISAVPPASFVTITPKGHTVSRYWAFDRTKAIRYRTDAEYEEHFRSVFAQSVRRRLRSNSPILAELSGGMDSSSIVCMADKVASNGTLRVPRIDTVSHFSNDEPHWDERPYFSKVEEWRGRQGLHVNVGLQPSSSFEIDTSEIPIWPHATFRPAPGIVEQLTWMRSQGHRVILSGLGGDEIMGGVPTPIPELQDLLVTGQFSAFGRQLGIWALQQRRPWFHLLYDVAQGFLPTNIRQLPAYRLPPDWVHPRFARRHQEAFLGYESRLKFFGPLPTFQENLCALETLRRQLACQLPGKVPYEKRYPFLDSDLLQFIFAVPREQLVRPGQRRSLMRRALAGIVPPEILHRKRKAYINRYPILAVAKYYERLVSAKKDLVSASLGMIVPELLIEAVEKTQRGQEVPVLRLLRTLGIEFWLRHLRTQGILTISNESFRFSFVGKYQITSSQTFSEEFAGG